MAGAPANSVYAGPNGADGQPTFRSLVSADLPPGGSGGALVLLEQHTASGSAELDFTSWYSTTYDEYLVEIVSLDPTATTGITVYVQLSSDGGSTYDTGTNYYYGRQYFSVDYGDSGSTSAGRNAAGFEIWNSDLLGPVNGSFRLFDPGQAVYPISFFGDSQGKNTLAHTYYIKWGQLYKPSTLVAVNAFRVLPSASTFASGTVRVYGIAKS